MVQVYGETSFELVEQMIKYVKFSEHDYFIDLGSGESLFCSVCEDVCPVSSQAYFLEVRLWQHYDSGYMWDV